MSAAIAMPFEEINPFVRMSKIQSFEKDAFPNFRKPYDCRLFYIYKGSGTLYFDDFTQAAVPGDLFLWQPGLNYRMDATTKEQPLVVITINFDFTQDYSHLTVPIPPERSESFNQKEMLPFINFANAERFKDPIYLRNMQSIQGNLLEMVSEYATRKTYYQQRLNGLMLSVLGYIARVSGLPSQYSTDKSINLIISYIHKNYARDIDNITIGTALSFHPNYINKLMVLHTGTSLHRYLLRYRVLQAIELLETTNTPIAEIAYATGFSDACHFSKRFKKETGFTPREYRRGNAG